MRDLLKQYYNSTYFIICQIFYFMPISARNSDIKSILKAIFQIKAIAITEKSVIITVIIQFFKLFNI